MYYKIFYYYENGEFYVESDNRDEVVEHMLEYLGFQFDFTTETEKSTAQEEAIEVMAEHLVKSYEVPEYDEDEWDYHFDRSFHREDY